jgi:aryl-alcohol dehydrogenase-like predicted oxidoreductase
VFPTCEELGIGQIVYSPLAQGVLTGKYRPDEEPPAGSRAADRKIGRYSTRFGDTELLEAVQRLRPLAERLSLTMSQLGLAWVLRDDRVTAAIIGASRPEQIDDNAGAVGVTLDRATLDEIDEVLAGHFRR